MNLKELKSIMFAKGYKFFEGDRNINLIGIRKDNKLSNEFDDKLVVVIQLNGQTKIKTFENFTTDPGAYYTKEKLLNKDGAAIMKPGQYRGLWQIGLHRGKYKALVQVGKCVVYRDGDKDEEIDAVLEDEGRFGINMHHAYDSEQINRYSAGCQVHQEDDQLNYVLRLCEVSAEVYGSRFTYTLLEESDFNQTEESKAKTEAKKPPVSKKTYKKKKKTRRKK